MPRLQAGSGTSSPEACPEGDLENTGRRLTEGRTRIPGVLVHGRIDLAGPPDVAWHLAQAWLGAELHFVAGGHRGDTEMNRLLLEVTDGFASRG